MAETNDYDPGPWTGYDYTTAKDAYTPSAGRSYGSYGSTSTSASTSTAADAAPVVPATVIASCKRPLVVAFDMTGSMGTWRDIIGEKLPYLDKEAPSYLGDDLEICFCAIGDAPMGDVEPLQVRPFARGTELAKHVAALHQTGGGGDSCESYELAGLYMARNAMYEPGARPVMIFIGDEGLHNRVERRHATWAHIDTGNNDVMTSDIMRELKEKYSVYIVRKPYPMAEAATQRQWVDMLGDDRVFILQAPERILDVIFGILALETGKTEYFQKEIEGRQTPDQVKTVYTSLRTNHVVGHAAATSAKLSASGSKSIMMLPGTDTAKKTKHLLSK